MRVHAFLLVALGGALGAMARYALSLALPKFDAFQGGMPIGTLTANAIGSFLIGVLTAYVLAEGKASEGFRLLLIVGVLGGFTTFSSFSWEFIQMLQAGRGGAAAIYWLLSSVLVPLLCAAGWSSGRALL